LTLDPTQLGRSKADLAETLKTIRKRVGLSQVRLASRCAISQSKISKIETGEITPTLVDVERILRALGAPTEVASEVIMLARTAGMEWQDFRAIRRKGLGNKQVELSSLERSSTEFRFFLLSMITGLLATPDYIRESIAHVTGDRSKVVAKKIERQAVLRDPAKKFTFILTEQAARWPILAPRGMATQLDRLVSLTYLPSVRLGVLPLSCQQAVGALNTYTVYDQRIVTVETSTGVLVLRDPKDVLAYTEQFTGYERQALFGNAARERLGEWCRLAGS
jgi:transcriptional regulator with XRE-family HTH domain